MADQTIKSDAGMFDVELLLKQARTYLAFGEQTRQFAERFQESLRSEADWVKALRQHFGLFREAIAQSATDPNVNPELARLWTLNLDTWQQAVTSLPSAPFALPDQQSVAWDDYQHAQADYLELLRQAALAALDLMEQRLHEQQTDAQSPSSLRALYNLWVDCNEETYGRMLRSPEYSLVSGRLFNTLFACYPKDGAHP